MNKKERRRIRRLSFYNKGVCETSIINGYIYFLKDLRKSAIGFYCKPNSIKEGNMDGKILKHGLTVLMVLTMVLGFLPMLTQPAYAELTPRLDLKER